MRRPLPRQDPSEQSSLAATPDLRKFCVICQQNYVNQQDLSQISLHADQTAEPGASSEQVATAVARKKRRFQSAETPPTIKDTEGSVKASPPKIPRGPSTSEVSQSDVSGSAFILIPIFGPLIDTQAGGSGACYLFRVPDTRCPRIDSQTERCHIFAQPGSSCALSQVGWLGGCGRSRPECSGDRVNIEGYRWCPPKSGSCDKDGQATIEQGSCRAGICSFARTYRLPVALGGGGNGRSPLCGTTQRSLSLSTVLYCFKAITYFIPMPESNKWPAVSVPENIQETSPR